MDHEYIGQLLGFTLAHSASVVETLEQDQAMVPFAITMQEDQQELVNFEAETQEQAVQQAEAKLAEFSNTFSAWCYGQEGMITLEDTPVHVMYFKVWLKGMTAPLEAYQPIQKSPFKLLGNIQIQNFVEAGLEQAQGESFIAGLNQGIDIHPATASRWDSWFDNEPKDDAE
ncbi:hypothetical protein HR45_15285 [Shewanella mangrovi]|uniref:Uncharacterized protein n=1 Tax=Shewanella mangrovi TaxID=1515746 RepID=A0A094J9Q4_9GAMM|nr:hypothetical protein [Shewanella mangrovi]KFZ36655.1 hypothetical protein HR45_15285 [Shewanella mangrovi]